MARQTGPCDPQKMKVRSLAVLAVALVPVSLALSADANYVGRSSEGSASATVTHSRMLLTLGVSRQCSSTRGMVMGTLGSLAVGPIRVGRDGRFADREVGTESIEGRTFRSRITVSGRRVGDVISGSFRMTSTAPGVTCTSRRISYRLTRR